MGEYKSQKPKQTFWKIVDFFQVFKKTHSNDTLSLKRTNYSL